MRLSQAPLHLVEQLSVDTFAAKFGDLRLVFRDGEVVHYYRSLLSLLSLEWRLLLQLCVDCEVIIMPDTGVTQFFGEMMEKEHIKESNDVTRVIYIEDDKEDIAQVETNSDALTNVLDVSEDITIQIDNQELKFGCSADDLSDTAKVTDLTTAVTTEVTDHTPVGVAKYLDYEDEDPPTVEAVDLTGHTGVVYLPAIKKDFSWPPRLTAPNFHSMGWRKAPGQSGDVVDILGNRSLFTVLSETCQDLPDRAAFLLPLLHEKDTQLIGIFHLRDFVNAQAADNYPAFQLEDTKERVRLEQLVTMASYIPDLSTTQSTAVTAASVKVYTGDNVSDLKQLMDAWKQNLMLDSKDLAEKEVYSLRLKCPRTTDGAIVCIYCGFICYSQSETGNYKRHINVHLFRTNKCRKCRKRKEGSHRSCHTSNKNCTICDKVLKGQIRSKDTCAVYTTLS